MQKSLQDSDLTRIQSELDDIQRMVLCMDGEPVQLKALEELRGRAEALEIELVKLAANTTSVSQPMDVMACFRTLKGILKTLQYKSLSSWEDDPNYKLNKPYMVRLMKDLETKTTLKPNQRRNLQKFLYYAPEILSKAYTTWNVKRGYESCGLYPPNIDTILSQCSAWKHTP